MKRFLVAAGLAVAIHGLFLAAEPKWLKEMTPQKAGPRLVSLRLAYLKKPECPARKSGDERPKSKNAVKGSEGPGKEPVPEIKEKVREHPTKPKSPKKFFKPKESVKMSSEPDKKNFSRVTPDTTAGSTPRPLPETQKRDVPEEVFDFSRVPPERFVRKARPIYRKNPPPEYPRLARRRGYQGTVVLKVLVGRKGRVGSVHTFTSSGYVILDRAAKESVRKWLFEPGVRDGDRVEMWVKIPIRFELK